MSRSFDRAQLAYDNACPPEDGPCECPECGGKGVDADLADCPVCEGKGWLDADGEPFDMRLALSLLEGP